MTRRSREVVVDGEPRTLEIPTGVFLGARGTPLVTAEPPEPDPDEEVEMVREMRERVLMTVVDGRVRYESSGSPWR